MPTSAAAFLLQAQHLQSFQVCSYSIHCLGLAALEDPACCPQQWAEIWCAGFAAFGVPSESPDASLLLAWLSRNMAMPAGLVMRMPADLPESIAGHVSHLLQRLLKVCSIFKAAAPNSASCKIPDALIQAIKQAAQNA